jgi:predicted aspartyl protease
MNALRSRWRWFPAVGLLLALLGPLRALAEKHFDLARPLKQLGYEAVELRRTGENHLFLVAKVDGRRRSCLVDTGWSFTTISTNTATRLAQTNLIAQLTLGRVSLTNESVRVEDLRVNGQPASYDMVLGCDFLQRHQAIIDCAGLRLYLRSAALTAQEEDELQRGLRAAGFGPVEMKLRQPWALTCESQVNGSAVAWLVDSGAMWSCLDAQVAQSLTLRVLPTINRMTGPATKGPRHFGVTELKSWRLGNLPLPETSVAVFRLKEWGLGPEGKLFSDVGGILGGAELQKLRAVIDCGARKLWLRPGR